MIATAPSCGAVNEAKAPSNDPIGVLTALTITGVRDASVAKVDDKNLNEVKIALWRVVNMMDDVTIS